MAAPPSVDRMSDIHGGAAEVGALAAGDDLRAANALLNSAETARAATVLQSRPRTIFVELTRSCNLACPMCRPAIVSHRSLAMTDEILDRVRTELFPYVEVVDLRGYGESALDNRLLPLVDEVNRLGATPKIITNLAPRAPGWWAELGSRAILVGISLEAASPGLYESTRRGARYPRFRANLEALRAAQLARGGEADLYFNVTVSDETVDEICGLVDLAVAHQIPLITLNPLFHDDDALGEGQRPRVGVSHTALPALRASLTAAQELAQRSGVELRVGANLGSGCSARGGYEQCIHPWSYVYIRHDGGIGFCDHLTTHDAAIYGHLATDDFMAVWNSPSYQQLRSDHGGRDFARLRAQEIECGWCYANRFTDAEHLIDPSKTFAILGRTIGVDELLTITPVTSPR